VDLRNNAVGIRLAGSIPRARYIGSFAAVREDRVKDLVSAMCMAALLTRHLTWLEGHL
jgi:hypothetical protein